MKEFSVVGKRLPRVEGIGKVTGVAVYSGDVFLPGMLFGKMLRCPHPHARILKLDVSKAKALPGVAAVITHEDVPAYKNRNPLLVIEMTHLSTGLVTYPWQPVAVVAAESNEIADQALKLIEVEYEVLTPIFDVLESMKPETPPFYADLHTNFIARPPTEKDAKPSNIAYHINLNKGDTNAGFEQADVVLENTFTTQAVHQGYIEPFAAIANVEPGGKVTIWTQSQGIFSSRAMVAEYLGLPVSKVRLMPVEIGGAFGGKSFLPLAPLVGLLAMKTGRPVRMEMSREEVLKDSRCAPGSICKVKLGATKDGKITAASGEFIYDAGGFPEMSHSMFVRGNAFSQYKIPNVKVDSYDVLTNKVPVTYYRGPSTPQFTFAVESQIDLMARTLGIDPIEFRILNINCEGDSTASGEVLTKVGFKETLETMAAHLKTTKKPTGKNQGRGVACGFWHGASGGFAAVINVNPDGAISLLTGVTDISGSRTSVAQIAAEEFGIPMSSVILVGGDTDTAPWGSNSVGSMTLYSLSHAVLRACEDVKAQLKPLAASRLSVDASTLEYADGGFRVKGDIQKNVPFTTLARSMSGRGGTGPVVGRGSTTGLPAAPAISVHVADVEVDKETGKVRVMSYNVCTDVGCAINPMSIEGQLQGAAVQGIGWALMEGYVFKDGVVQNGNLLDYRLPTAVDVPNVDTLLVEVPSTSGVYGARNVGESPLIPAIATIANAIADATGARMKNAPMNPETVLKELKAQARP